jgi:hypothetical protein
VPSLLLLLPHLELQALLLADSSTGGPPMTPLQKCVVAGRAGSAYVLLCRAASLPAPALLSVLNPSSVPASSLASYWRSFSSSHGDVDPASRWDSVAGSPGSLPPPLAAILSFLPHLEPGSPPPPLPLDAAAPVLLPAPAADPAAVWSSQFCLACPPAPAPAPALHPAPAPDPPPPRPAAPSATGAGSPPSRSAAAASGSCACPARGSRSARRTRANYSMPFPFIFVDKTLRVEVSPCL